MVYLRLSVVFESVLLHAPPHLRTLSLDIGYWILCEKEGWFCWSTREKSPFRNSRFGHDGRDGKEYRPDPPTVVSVTWPRGNCPVDTPRIIEVDQTQQKGRRTGLMETDFGRCSARWPLSPPHTDIVILREPNLPDVTEERKRGKEKQVGHGIS